MPTHHRVVSAAGLAAFILLACTASAWSTTVDITARHKAPLGTYLTNGSGRTVYMFTADKNGANACHSTCAEYWPPVLTTGTPKTGSGAQASALGTIKHGNKEQVTYDGKPLYYFAGDSAAGSTAGEGLVQFGGAWYVVSPSGKGILRSGKKLATAAKTW